MPLNRETAIIGAAIRLPQALDSASLEELLYDLTRAALADAGLAIEEIDGIVVGSNDQFDGRAIAVMAASGSVGGVDRDILSTPSASDHAFVMGVLRIASGQYETQLVLSWSPTEADSLSEAQRLGADPYFHRHLPLDELNAAALQASRLAAADPGIAAQAQALAAHNRAAGAKAHGLAPASPLAPPWPLTAPMLARPVTGLVALVLASEDFVAARGLTGVAWVQGMGWATEAGFLGDRDLTGAEALRAAAGRAYAEAGIGDPAGAFDAVELSGVTPYQEVLAARVLGLGGLVASGAASVNPSGGVTAQNPVFCTGLMRIAEIANQIRGRAGRHQLPGVKRGLAHAASGFAGMYQGVLVLGNEQREGSRA